MAICEPWKRVEPVSLPSSRIEQRLLAMAPAEVFDEQLRSLEEAGVATTG
ncbi:hypothetical protein ACTQ49_14850 [Luteococcus sp. Sow4_B9]